MREVEEVEKQVVMEAEVTLAIPLPRVVGVGVETPVEPEAEVEVAEEIPEALVKD